LFTKFKHIYKYEHSSIVANITLSPTGILEMNTNVVLLFPVAQQATQKNKKQIWKKAKCTTTYTM